MLPLASATARALKRAMQLSQNKTKRLLFGIIKHLHRSALASDRHLVFTNCHCSGMCWALVGSFNVIAWICM